MQTQLVTFTNTDFIIWKYVTIWKQNELRFMLTSNSKQWQATYQKCAARKLMKNKSPGVSIWKTAMSEGGKTKHTTAIHKGNYIWYKEDEKKIKPGLRMQERSGMRSVFYSNNAFCMRHEHNEQLATGERTESQTPQRPRIPLLRCIPADDRLMWPRDRREADWGISKRAQPQTWNMKMCPKPQWLHKKCMKED